MSNFSKHRLLIAFFDLKPRSKDSYVPSDGTATKYMFYTTYFMYLVVVHSYLLIGASNQKMLLINGA